ncbi:hypothetical protein [Pseudoalteromonas luteoviolacea]|uniref:Lipoprotein n=1 Tax=Pseudoalteromonas luteoviolacea S4054 TaxID=1129367 RepID=A0A0F6A6G0_9GAMM|nr:hypothetical protein [Pseudoalteromonas luteoviolacea]AOT09122.1 hypothetical protein S4054249_15245 [Pseudoalteromonas luteoviolacea]AOT14035.1 hypothetical protein S40542_15215 [Pseudoalteromonas luteoviolacea]AOT18950.1 hypothetical protein S4054_15220 [Pseudoalteromonas luteoviolacea]KKE81019.1 hypothetical protein N479_23845 [Pseudoalteromonas luteoviolacea S4054]KZN70295.1 hypothetical protein N481_02145 [Pseudoalteromonas luteoviolacea S4047-1]
MKNKHNKNTLISAATLLVLSGCGSSNKSLEHKITPPKPKPEVNQVALKTVYDGCNSHERLPNVDIVFHDASGGVVSTHTSDANGEFKSAIPDQAVHLSVVEPRSVQPKNRMIRTFMDIDGDVNLGSILFIRPKNAPSCSLVGPKCGSVSLDTSKLDVAYEGYKLITGEGSTRILGQADSSTYPIRLSVCDDQDNYHVALVSPDSTSAQAAKLSNLAHEEQVYLQADDFVYSGVAVSDPGLENLHDSDINTFAAPGFEQPVFSEIPFIFPELGVFRFYEAGRKNTITVNRDKYFIYSGAMSRIDETGQIQLEAPIEIDIAPVDMLMSFNSLQYSYDFAHMDERINEVTWTIKFTDVASDKYNWRISGDVTGSVPSFQFGHVLNQNSLELSELSYIRLALSGLPDISTDLNTYRTRYAAMTKDGQVDHTQVEAQSYVYKHYFHTKRFD